MSERDIFPRFSVKMNFAKIKSLQCVSENRKRGNFKGYFQKERKFSLKSFLSLSLFFFIALSFLLFWLFLCFFSSLTVSAVDAWIHEAVGWKKIFFRSSHDSLHFNVPVATLLVYLRFLLLPNSSLHPPTSSSRQLGKCFSTLTSFVSPESSRLNGIKAQTISLL